jgi:hypothetical protein
MNYVPFSIIKVVKDGVDHSGRATEDMKCLLPLKHLNREFEFRSSLNVRLRFFCVVLSCVGNGLATGRSTFYLCLCCPV